MTNSGIDGLELNGDGGFRLRGTPVPAAAEFPAVQLGEWTVSKAMGTGRPLNASRGDGIRLVFEFKNGKWYKTTMGTVGGLRQGPRQTHDPGDFAKQLEQLATVPLDVFHWWPITEAEPHPHAGLDPHIDDEHTEGEIRFYNDGTVVLGSECFPPGVGINHYRFGGSIAYREWGGGLLVVASPGSIRFYYSRCRTSSEGSYGSLNLTDVRVTRNLWVEAPKPTPPPKWLRFLFADAEQSPDKVQTSVVSSQRLYSYRDPNGVLVGQPAHVYLSSDRSVFVRLWGNEVGSFRAAYPDIQLVSLTIPWTYEDPHVKSILVKTGIFKNTYRYVYDIPDPYFVIPRGGVIDYKGRNISIDSRMDFVSIQYKSSYTGSHFHKATNTPSAFGDWEARKYLIERGESTYRFAVWDQYCSCGGWDWYKLTPRHGAVAMPPIGASPLKRLGWS